MVNCLTYQIHALLHMQLFSLLLRIVPLDYFQCVLFKLSESRNDIRQQDLHKLSAIFAFPSVRQFGN